MGRDLHDMLVAAPAARYAQLEYQPRDQRSRVQDALLREHVRYVAKHSPFYQDWFARHDVDPAAITSAAELPRIPCTSKDHLAENNDRFRAVAAEDIGHLSHVCNDG